MEKTTCYERAVTFLTRLRLQTFTMEHSVYASTFRTNAHSLACKLRYNRTLCQLGQPCKLPIPPPTPSLAQTRTLLPT
eukprot:5700921-Pleurochrysis_carterae.AAC.1